jgi:hypothetical protein
MVNNKEPMSKRLVRPTKESYVGVNRTLDQHEAPNPKNKMSLLESRSHNSSVIHPKNFENKLVLNANNNLPNQRVKVLNARNETLLMNRGTSDDNLLKRVGK